MLNRAGGAHQSKFRLTDQPGDEPVCRDCVHHVHTGSVATQCIRDECSTFDRIEGRLSVTPEEARNKGHCGMSGKYFERRRPSWLDRNLGRVLGWVVVLGILAFLAEHIYKSGGPW